MQSSNYKSSLELLLKVPGQPVKLPNYILEDLKNLHPKYKRNINFFGGHPVSITKQSLHNIFTQIKPNSEGFPQSQYLVCQKTDGVRYILLLCHVQQQNLVQQKNSNLVKKYGSTQCYLVSRQGQKGLVAYSVNMKIGHGWAKKSQCSFRHIIQILDGQLVVDDKVGQNGQTCKFLIFDILVHLQQNITNLPLLHRLKQINKFIQCNNFLLDNTPSSLKQTNSLGIQMKDFFRLNSQKYNIVKFLLNKYINCLPHENDGLIFNHQSKEYQFGINQGYIKWKPAHLNTLDFMLVPNTNLSQRFGNKVLDLYLATRDLQIQGNYVRFFYGFTIVDEEEFQKIQQQISINKDKIYQQKVQDQQQNGDKSHFEGAVVAECKFQQTNSQQKSILKQLYDIHKDPSQIYEYVMKPYDEVGQKKRIQTLQKMIYDRCWKIYKVREDKGLPNNLNVAQKIEQSIKDNILEDEIIRRNDELNEKIYGRRS